MAFMTATFDSMPLSLPSLLESSTSSPNRSPPSSSSSSTIRFPNPGPVHDDRRRGALVGDLHDQAQAFEASSSARRGRPQQTEDPFTGFGPSIVLPSISLLDPSSSSLTSASASHPVDSIPSISGVSDAAIGGQQERGPGSGGSAETSASEVHVDAEVGSRGYGALGYPHPGERASAWQPSSVPNHLSFDHHNNDVASASTSSSGPWTFAPSSLPHFGVAGAGAGGEMLPSSAPSTLWAAPDPNYHSSFMSTHRSVPVSHPPQPQSHPLSWTSDYGVGLDHSSSYQYDAGFAYSPPSLGNGHATDYANDSFVPRQAAFRSASAVQLQGSSLFGRLPGLPQLGLDTTGLTPSLGAADFELSPTHTDPSPLPGSFATDSTSPATEHHLQRGEHSTSPDGEGEAEGGEGEGKGKARSSAGPTRRGKSKVQVEQFPIWGPGQRPPIKRSVTAPVKPETDPELRKYRCEICGKGFKRSGTFNQHKRTHTGERPHLCPVPGCGKAFQTTSNLKRHIKTHRGWGPAPSSSSTSTSKQPQFFVS